MIVKKPMNIPKISRRQMEMVFEDEPAITLQALQDMMREMSANHYDCDAFELAFTLIEAAREGVPLLGPNGKTFVNIIVAWEPWKWDDAV